MTICIIDDQQDIEYTPELAEKVDRLYNEVFKGIQRDKENSDKKLPKSQALNPKIE